MEMSSSQFLPVSQREAWQALNDPEILKACIPGCDSMDRVSDTEYQVGMTAKVGPVSAKFRGRMLLSDLDPPRSYKLTFEGQGGPAGFAKGAAEVSLAPESNGTRLGYVVRAQVGGKLAQIGSRLIDGAAKKIADDFFAAFLQKLGPVRDSGRAAQAEPGVEAEPGTRKVSIREQQRWLWLAGAILLALIVYAAVHMA